MLSRIAPFLASVHAMGSRRAPPLVSALTPLGAGDFVSDLLERQGAVPALRGYRGFPCSICTSVNNVAAHGVPSSRKLEDGDIVSLDITVSVDGWHGDAAWTYIVGTGGPDSRRLLKAVRPRPISS